MRKLAMEVQMPAVTFNDSGDCLGQMRQVFAAIRAQLREEGNIEGTVMVSVLVRVDEPETESVN